MDQFYNTFYIQEVQDNFSEENDCFQAWNVDKSLSDACQVQIFKNIEINPPPTQNTFYNNTLSLHIDQFTNQPKQKPTENATKLPEKNQKQKNQKQFNQIETSMYRLEKTVKSYKGQSQETVNLNKYYGKCLKDYVQTLAACHIVDESEITSHLEKLKNNEINTLKLSGQVGEYCAKYVKSPHIIHKLLTSHKMNFNNKITSIKYIHGFADKLQPGKTHCKIWKNERS